MGQDTAREIDGTILCVYRIGKHARYGYCHVDGRVVLNSTKRALELEMRKGSGLWVLFNSPRGDLYGVNLL